MQKNPRFLLLAIVVCFSACKGHQKKVLVYASDKITVDNNQQHITVANGDGTTHHEQELDFTSGDPVTLNVETPQGKYTITIPDDGLFIANVKNDTVVGSKQHIGTEEGGSKITQDALKQKLEARGLVVNVLPRRETLLEHLGDVRNHRCLVGGDSLPMHFALSTGTRCVTLFNCTSPWEIHDYSLQQKIISPLLAEFFYQRSFDPRATTAISLDEVFGEVMNQLDASAPGTARKFPVNLENALATGA